MRFVFKFTKPWIINLSWYENVDRYINPINKHSKYIQTPKEDEIIEIIQRAILEVGASSVKDMGKIMSVIKAELNGRADMGKVGSMIKSQLS